MRICEKCGHSVIVGQGKWVGTKGKPETLRLYHKSVALCEAAQSYDRTKEKSLAQARNAKSKASTDESDAPQGNVAQGKA